MRRVTWDGGALAGRRLGKNSSGRLVILVRFVSFGHGFGRDLEGFACDLEPLRCDLRGGQCDFKGLRRDLEWARFDFEAPG